MCWHSCCWKSKWNRHASVPFRHPVRVSLRAGRESELTPCGVARRRVRLRKARWSYLPTDDSCVVLSDSSVWKVLWIQSQMPPLLWYSCLDTKSTWTSIWSQHAALHVRQPLSQNRLFFFFPLPRSLPPSLCISPALSAAINMQANTALQQQCIYEGRGNKRKWKQWIFTQVTSARNVLLKLSQRFQFCRWWGCPAFVQFLSLLQIVWELACAGARPPPERTLRKLTWQAEK